MHLPLRPLVLATRSVGKIRELRALCAAQGFSTETLDDAGLVETRGEDGIEVFETFAENAEAKARYFAERLPGRAILAEDSGLEVDALGGAPGVRSKRWASSTATGADLDAANNAALMLALAQEPHRAARYRCVAVCVSGRESWCGEGSVEGTMTRVARGTAGFGYDPYFESLELGKTFGEALPEEKSRVSHRARAVRALMTAASGVLCERVLRVS